MRPTFVLFLLSSFRFDNVEATFHPANSSIRPWLDFDGTNLPNLGSCHRTSYNESSSSFSVENTPCASICNHSDSLYYASFNMTQQINANLANCGIWLTLVAAYSNSTNFTLSLDASQENWDGFADSTLNLIFRIELLQLPMQSARSWRGCIPICRDHPMMAKHPWLVLQCRCSLWTIPTQATLAHRMLPSDMFGRCMIALNRYALLRPWIQISQELE